MKTSISPTRVRTKLATVSRELASDAIACACETSDKHTSERISDQDSHFIELRVPRAITERVVVSLALFPPFLRVLRLPSEDSGLDFTGAKGQPRESCCDGTVRFRLQGDRLRPSGLRGEYVLNRHKTLVESCQGRVIARTCR